LVGGTTGSGKTEWTRSAIASVVCRYSHEAVRVVIIDMKRAKFLELERSPHLFNPLTGAQTIIKNADDAVAAWAALVAEMEARYKLIESEGCADIATYQRKTGTVVPRILIFSDESDDLMLTHGKEVLASITRMGKKAREAGIHIAAYGSQRPDKDTVPGALKANLPARIALRCKDQVNSQIILGSSDACQLLGKGDLIFCGTHEATRLHGLHLQECDRDGLFPSSESSQAPASSDNSQGVRESLERLLQLDSTDSIGHSSEVPNTAQNSRNDADLFREIRELRELGTTKGEICDGWGMRRQEAFKEYDRIISLFCEQWCQDLIAEGVSDDSIIKLVWSIPGNARRKFGNSEEGERVKALLARLRDGSNPA
jgi:DNA segregation ATPase FtsK/SpoIIIE-like protein